MFQRVRSYIFWTVASCSEQSIIISFKLRIVPLLLLIDSLKIKMVLLYFLHLVQGHSDTCSGQHVSMSCSSLFRRSSFFNCFDTALSRCLIASFRTELIFFKRLFLFSVSKVSCLVLLKKNLIIFETVDFSSDDTLVRFCILVSLLGVKFHFYVRNKIKMFGVSKFFISIPFTLEGHLFVFRVRFG